MLPEEQDAHRCFFLQHLCLGGGTGHIWGMQSYPLPELQPSIGIECSLLCLESQLERAALAAGRTSVTCHGASAPAAAASYEWCLCSVCPPCAIFQGCENGLHLPWQPWPYQPLSWVLPVAIGSLDFLGVSLAKETPKSPLYLKISCSVLARPAFLTTDLYQNVC